MKTRLSTTGYVAAVFTIVATAQEGVMNWFPSKYGVSDEIGAATC